MIARRRYRELTCLACAVTAAVVGIVTGGQIGADGSLLDLLVGARSRTFPANDPSEQAPVAVIALDKRSLDAPELAPYPRALLAPIWAAVLDAAFDAGARAVGFDLILSYSANQFVPDFDRPLLARLATYRDRLVLARSATTLPARPYLAALRYDDRGVGLAELTADPDGRYRRVRDTYETLRDSPLPGLAGAVLRRAETHPMPHEIVLAPRRHLEAIPTYALIDVVRCAHQGRIALREAFAGKIVLIGSTLPEEDRRVSSGRFLAAQRNDAEPLHSCGLRRLGASAPESPTVPGVFLHAAAMEAVASGRVTSTAPTIMVAVLAAAAATVGSALGMVSAPWLAGAVVIGMAMVLLGAGTVALAANLWIPLALPLAALAVAPVIAYLVRYLVEERTRRRIRDAFCHYLAPTIVDRLASDPSALKLGGELREVTVMFADLSGFTALSVKVEPDVLTRKTNQYLGYIVEHVEVTGGYVDKFIGDAVMALWGAPAADPHHAVNGIRAAMAAVARIGRERKAAAARGEIGFSVKIGLNSGPAVVGNVGTDKRYSYTAAGDTVNVASRLEGVPELYGCEIVVGPRTAELARAEFLMRELGAIQVKGRDAPLTVFEPVADHGNATPQQIAHVQRYVEALAHFRSMRFADAYAIWNALARDEWDLTRSERGDGQPSGPAQKMAERARALAAHPPAQPWDGVWVLTSK